MRISDWSSDVCSSDLDMLVDDVGLRIEMIVPDMFEQHRARHHPPFVAREIGEDAKFARGEVDRLAAAPHRLTEQIDLEIADAQPGLRDYRGAAPAQHRSEEHTSELQSLMRISYAVFCLKKK